MINEGTMCHSSRFRHDSLGDDHVQPSGGEAPFGLSQSIACNKLKPEGGGLDE